jgi:hypothetical protein
MPLHSVCVRVCVCVCVGARGCVYSLAVIWRIVKEKADEQVEDHPVSKAIARLTKQQATRLDGTHVIPRPNKASIDNFTNEQRKLHGGGGDWTLLPNRNGYFHYGGRTNFRNRKPEDHDGGPNHPLKKLGSRSGGKGGGSGGGNGGNAGARCNLPG